MNVPRASFGSAQMFGVNLDCPARSEIAVSIRLDTQRLRADDSRIIGARNHCAKLVLSRFISFTRSTVGNQTWSREARPQSVIRCAIGDQVRNQPSGLESRSSIPMGRRQCRLRSADYCSMPTDPINANGMRIQASAILVEQIPSETVAMDHSITARTFVLVVLRPLRLDAKQRDMNRICGFAAEGESSLIPFDAGRW